MRCPLCPGEGEDIGSLGRARYFKCRDCGYLFYKMQKTRRQA